MKYKHENFKKGHKDLSKRNADLKKLLARHKINFQPSLKRSPYESLVRAIAHQQLHGKAAETILGRMLNLFPKKSFPNPQDLLKLKPEELRKCGFSNSKVKSIRDISQKTIDGVVPTSMQIHRMQNQEIIDRLTEIYGVGRWTVEMMLIFQLGRLDIWPVDDFGVRKGFQVWKKLKQMPTAKDVKVYSTHYEPYQSIVALCLWREADLAKTKTQKGKK